MLRIVNVRCTTARCGRFAIDIQDLEDARFEARRYMESQRERPTG